MRFRDRTDAGRQLARRVGELDLVTPVVLGLPRGGLLVAAEVAASIGAPLDVFVARKIGMPGHAELGIGAVAEGLADPVVSPAASMVGVGPDDLRTLAERAYRELRRQVSYYRGDRPLPVLTGRDVVLVDDGVATGVTAEAALVALGGQRPNRLVLAVAVCTPDARARLAAFADDVVCAHLPAELIAVGVWFEDFSEVTDQEVVDALERGRIDLDGG